MCGHVVDLREMCSVNKGHAFGGDVLSTVSVFKPGPCITGTYSSVIRIDKRKKENMNTFAGGRWFKVPVILCVLYVLVQLMLTAYPLCSPDILARKCATGHK